MLLILGDRYEILASASTAHTLNTSIIHFCREETTEGAIDYNIRYAISKLSGLLFTASENYPQCVIQMEKVPKKKHNIKSLEIEDITQLKSLDFQHLYKYLCLEIKPENLFSAYPREKSSLKEMKKVFQKIIIHPKRNDALI